MSDPRFRPREMACPRDRQNFGKSGEISWLQGASESEASQIEAARLQHALALKITARLREKGYSIRAYANMAGVGYDRMAKVLRGEALMRLEDVSDAERLLGAVVQPLIHETESS